MSYDVPEIAASLARMTAALESQAEAMKDMEHRVRRLERFYWAVLGGTAVVSSLAHLLLHTSGK